MTEKEFYKEIRRAITVSVNRFYTDVHFDGDEEMKKKTIKSIFYEYKKYYQEKKI
jgi:hypothetical protein